MYDLFSIQPVIDLRISIPLFGFTMLICYAVSEALRISKDNESQLKLDGFIDASRTLIATVILKNQDNGRIDDEGSVVLLGKILKFNWIKDD